MNDKFVDDKFLVSAKAEYEESVVVFKEVDHMNDNEFEEAMKNEFHKLQIAHQKDKMPSTAGLPPSSIKTLDEWGKELVEILKSQANRESDAQLDFWFANLRARDPDMHEEMRKLVQKMLKVISTGEVNEVWERTVDSLPCVVGPQDNAIQVMIKDLLMYRPTFKTYSFKKPYKHGYVLFKDERGNDFCREDWLGLEYEGEPINCL